jgi:hypothetical protein
MRFVNGCLGLINLAYDVEECNTVDVMIMRLIVEAEIYLGETFERTSKVILYICKE